MFALDIDKERSELHKLMAFFNCRYVFGKTPEVRWSASGSGGLHYFYPDMELTVENDLILRGALGDCPGRRWFSERRAALGGPVEILFDGKQIGKKWRKVKKADEKTVIALPAWLARGTKNRGKRGRKK